MSNEIKQAMETIGNEIQNDEGYALGWQANLAMAFYDAIPPEVDQDTDWHTVVNDGAKRFMANAFPKGD